MAKKFKLKKLLKGKPVQTKSGYDVSISRIQIDRQGDPVIHGRFYIPQAHGANIVISYEWDLNGKNEDDLHNLEMV